jgi:hypothetical protein
MVYLGTGLKILRRMALQHIKLVNNHLMLLMVKSTLRSSSDELTENQKQTIRLIVRFTIRFIRAVIRLF